MPLLERGSVSADATQDRPNLLLILMDQLRRDALGVYGSWAPTPHIDAIAADGMVFDRAVTVSPVCMPARFALASGRYPHNFGLWNNGPVSLSSSIETFMSSIRDAGYATSVFGKLHLSTGHRDIRDNEDFVRRLGFDVVYETVGPRGCVRSMSHMTAAWERQGLLENFRADIGRRLSSDPMSVRPSTLPLEWYYDVHVPSKAIEHLESSDSSAPWFMNLSFAGPHEPWDAPEPYASMFDPADAPPAIATKPVDFPPRSSLDATRRLADDLDDRSIAALRANYAGSVALIDDQVGRVVNAIKARGEWDNTVVVISSDHGEMNGDHGLVYKGTFLEAVVEIPLIVRSPGAVAGRSDELVELIDVGATLVDFAGAEPRPDTFGRSLRNPSEAPREVALSEFEGEYMVWDGRNKLIVNAQGDSAMLFDRVEDPDERHDLLGHADYDEVERELRDKLLRRLAVTAVRIGRRAASSPVEIDADRLSEALAKHFAAGRG